MNYYISPEDFELAKSNGIGYQVIYERFYTLGWDIKKAATHPVKHKGQGLWFIWGELAKSNSISRATFYRRLKYPYNMNPEEAASKRKERRDNAYVRES